MVWSPRLVWASRLVWAPWLPISMTPSCRPRPVSAASVARSRPDTTATVTPSSAAAARNASRAPGTARACMGSSTKGDRVPSKSTATSTRGRAAKAATAIRRSLPASVTRSPAPTPCPTPSGWPARRRAVAGAGRPVRPQRRRSERVEIAGGPPLHVVVGDALAQRLHPARSLVLGGGDRAHDRLLDALDVVRVADEGLVELVPRPGELAEDERAAEVGTAGDVLLGDEVHAVT